MWLRQAKHDFRETDHEQSSQASSLSCSSLSPFIQARGDGSGDRTVAPHRHFVVLITTLSHVRAQPSDHQSDPLLLLNARKCHYHLKHSNNGVKRESFEIVYILSILRFNR